MSLSKESKIMLITEKLACRSFNGDNSDEIEYVPNSKLKYISSTSNSIPIIMHKRDREPFSVFCWKNQKLYGQKGIFKFLIFMDR